MTTTVYSPSQQASVDNLLAVPVWAKGVRNRDQMPFFSFTSSTRSGVVYHTRYDGQFCTCPGAERSRSGLCCHRIAVVERAHIESLEDGLASPAEIDCFLAGVAADAAARAEARARSAAAYTRLFGED